MLRCSPLILLCALAGCSGDRATRGPVPLADDGADTALGDPSGDAGTDTATDDGGDDGGDDGPGYADDCEPGGEPTTQPDTFLEYAAMCEPHLGVAPVVDCGAGVEIPIHVDGVEVREPQERFACDIPSLQIGDCIPGSSVQRYEGRDADGTPRPEVVWVSLCRSDGMETVEGDRGDIADSVQLIGYNTESGATCFFESGDNEAWISLDEDNRLVGTMPGPGDPGFATAYTTPGLTVCVECHQSDPFVHNPWIDQARWPEDEDQPVIPVLSDPNPPYFVVGGSDWDMRTIHVQGNACLGCHRVGMETDALYRSHGYPADALMPPSSPGALADDYEELLDCWSAGPEQTDGCEWVIPPGGGCDGGIVGDDYPHKSDQYNDGDGENTTCDDGTWFSVTTADGLTCTFDCHVADYGARATNPDACEDWITYLHGPCSPGDTITFGTFGDDGASVPGDTHACEDGAWPL